MSPMPQPRLTTRAGGTILSARHDAADQVVADGGHCGPGEELLRETAVEPVEVSLLAVDVGCCRLMTRAHLIGRAQRTDTCALI